MNTVLGANARHVETQKRVNELFRLIDEEKNEEAEQLLQQLSELLGRDDREIQQAKSLLAWNYMKSEEDAVH